MRPHIAVLYAPGINCHEETAFALEIAGLGAEIVNFHDILAGERELTRWDGLVVPGGFSWGDHLGAGRIFGVHLIAQVADQLRQLVENGKPILGICNGFQVLVETGLLPDRNIGNRSVALLQNKSAVFESRWVELIVEDAHSIWTHGLSGRILRMPVAHGEGRLYSPEQQWVRPLIYYSKNGLPTEEYPANPNGSPRGIAGICDTSGLIFGLMPHPERAVLEWQGSTDGMALFRNLTRYLCS